MKSLHCLYYLLCISCLAASGCEQQQNTVADKEYESVVAVGSQWYGHIPVWVGIERGIFKQHGFNVNWRVIGKSMDRLNAISSGDAHFASLGEIAMISAMAQGNRRFYWVGNQDIAPGFEGLVARPGISSFADLKGKTIGFPFGSSVDLTCRLLLKQHGLNPGKDVHLVNLEVGDVPAVFRAGNVDAALIWEPGFSQLRAVKGANLLAMDTDTQVYQKFGTMTGPDVLIMGKKWVDKDPARAQRFLRAYFEALDWVAAYPEKAVDTVHGKYIHQDQKLIKANVNKFVWHNAQQQQSVMSEQGLYPQAELIIDILYNEMKAIPIKPVFRDWIRLDLLPADRTSGLEKPSSG